MTAVRSTAPKVMMVATIFRVNAHKGNAALGQNHQRDRFDLATLRSAGCPSPRETRSWLLARLCRMGLVTRRVPLSKAELLQSRDNSQASPSV